VFKRIFLLIVFYEIAFFAKANEIVEQQIIPDDNLQRFVNLKVPTEEILVIDYSEKITDKNFIEHLNQVKKIQNQEPNPIYITINKKGEFVANEVNNTEEIQVLENEVDLFIAPKASPVHGAYIDILNQIPANYLDKSPVEIVTGGSVFKSVMEVDEDQRINEDSKNEIIGLFEASDLQANKIEIVDFDKLSLRGLDKPITSGHIGPNVVNNRFLLGYPVTSVKRTLSDDRNGIIFYAELGGDNPGSALLELDSKGKVSGSIETLTTHSFVTSLEEGITVVATSNVENKNYDQTEDDVFLPSGFEEIDIGHAFGDNLYTTCENPTETQYIDIAVGITNNAIEATIKDRVNIEEVINDGFFIANRMFASQGINVRVRKVGENFKLDESYKQKGNLCKDALALTQSAEKPLKKLRKHSTKNNSDVVLLVNDYMSDSHCGYAGGIGVKLKKNSIATVNWRCIRKRYSFIHEIAHLVGAWHNPESLNPKIRNLNKTPDYAHGHYCYPNEPSYSIMGRPYAYDDEGKKSLCKRCILNRVWSGGNNLCGNPQLSNVTCLWKKYGYRLANISENTKKDEKTIADKFINKSCS